MMEKCLYKIAQEKDRRLEGYNSSRCSNCDGRDERCLNYRTLWDSIWDEINVGGDRKE